MVRVLVFGKLKEVVNGEVIEAPAFSTLNQLREWLLREYPSLRNEQFAIAVNRKLQAGNVPLKEGDEVALLPPIAGG